MLERELPAARRHEQAAYTDRTGWTVRTCAGNPQLVAIQRTPLVDGMRMESDAIVDRCAWKRSGIGVSQYSHGHSVLVWLTF